MSKKYREITETQMEIITTPDMRMHCQRPGTTDDDGNIVYFTEQSHKDRCEINKIIRKYDQNGIINHVSKFEAQYGDVSGIEFKSAQDKVLNAKKMFNELPSHIRKRFENSPAKLLSFMDDANNREEAIKLGIIRADWTIDSDGIGEHVKQGKNVQKKEIKEPAPTEEPTT